MTLLRSSRLNRRPPSRARKLFLERLETRSLLHAGNDESPISFPWLASDQNSYLPSVTQLQEYGKLLTGPAPGEPLAAAWDFLRSRRGELRLNADDATSYAVSSQYVDEKSGATHLYLRQTVAGIEVWNADLGIHVTARGEVINATSSFVAVPFVAELVTQPSITAAQALAALNSAIGNRKVSKVEVSAAPWPNAT